jgi:hypothetical protein
MIRLAILCFVLLTLAACGTERPETPLRVRAATAFTGPEATAIEVHVYEMPPGTVIEEILVLGPDGERFAAAELVHSTSETGPGFVARPGIGVAVTGGSSSGVTPSVSLGYGVTRKDGPSRRSRRVSATVGLPDPAAYRTNWAAWRAEVHYTDVTSERRVLTLPTPRPY